MPPAFDDEETDNNSDFSENINSTSGATFFEEEDEEQDNSNSKNLDRDFGVAIKMLMDKFPGENGKGQAAKALYPLIERSTVDRFFKNGVNHDYQSIQKRRLIWYFDNGPEKFLYRFVADRLSSDHNNKKILIKRYSGSYTYFRYYAPTNNLKDLTYVSGKINIFGENGLPKFDHWSHNYSDPEGEAEHSGYIFQASSHLFYVGTGNNVEVLRLGISEIPRKKVNWMTGLIVSLRSDWPNDPFAARFLMVNDKNHKLISDLKNRDIDPSSHGRTMGESLFFSMTQGDYAYYMLSKHSSYKK